MLSKAVIALSMIASGIASAAIAQVQPSEADNSECTFPGGWHEVTERQPRFVVFGELHGTEQGPKFLGSLACALALDGERILVAIEHNASDDPALQAAWARPVERFERSLAATGWADRKDGVASAAMFDLVRDLHSLKERGLPIAIVAFNGPRDGGQALRLAGLPGQGPSDAAQAENIGNAANSGNYDRILVLVGDLHARKDTVDQYGPAFEPMARRLSRYGRVISLNMSYANGSSWNCILKDGVIPGPGRPLRKEDIECGAQRTTGNATFEGPPFIRIKPGSDGELPEPYDGTFWVGPISASPPAVP